MQRDIRPIPLDLVKLDQENVRFGSDVARNQREAISLLMADPLDGQKILRLAKHIAEYGLDPTELQLVTPDENEGYIVLEGNRRLTALKLLQNPDLCPDGKLAKGFKEASDKIGASLPEEIECSVVSSRSAGDMWIELKHTGENSGVGRVQWDGDIRDERRARHTGIESVGRQIRRILSENPDKFSEVSLKGAGGIPVTTLTRLFSSKPAQEALGYKIENKKISLSYPLKLISPALEYVIETFVNEGFNVNDIRSDSDRVGFFQHLPPELSPKLASELMESSGSQAVRSEGTDSAYREEPHSGANELKDSDSNPEKEKPTRKRIRSRPSSRARKYLIPWPLNVRNDRVNAIYRELRYELQVENVVNAVSITFRVFIELSCNELILRAPSDGGKIIREDNGKELNIEDKLSTKVTEVANYLKKMGKITPGEAKAISKRASTQNTIGSIDHFNQFVHDSSSPPIPSEIKYIADEYKPMLEAIWE